MIPRTVVSHSSSPLSKGANIGIAVGIAVGLFILGGLAYIIVLFRRSSKYVVRGIQEPSNPGSGAGLTPGVEMMERPGQLNGKGGGQEAIRKK